MQFSIHKKSLKCNLSSDGIDIDQILFDIDFLLEAKKLKILIAIKGIVYLGLA